MRVLLVRNSLAVRRWSEAAPLGHRFIFSPSGFRSTSAPSLLLVVFLTTRKPSCALSSTQAAGYGWQGGHSLQRLVDFWGKFAEFSPLERAEGMQSI